MHLQNANLYGNSTDLQYFYVDLYVGSEKQKQSLIVDTGSGIAAFPCGGYCYSCGTGHLNNQYQLDMSKSKYVYNCNQDSDCDCGEGGRCKFLQAYGEGSTYRGFLVKD